MNITGSRDGKVFFIDNDKVMIDGKMYYEKSPQNLPKADAYSLLADVRVELKAASWEADNWSRVVDLDTVYKILSEHFS